MYGDQVEVSIAAADDAVLSNPQNNQVLAYSSATSKWVNTTNPTAPVSSVAGKTGAVALVKADVGLGSVDNTSDLGKPVSTATQTALDGKANTSHTHSIASLTDFAAEIRKTDANAYHNGTAYPLRNTVTSDSARRVRWVGPTAPTIGSGYAINNLDVWEQTT